MQLENALGTDQAGVLEQLDALKKARKLQYELGDEGFVIERHLWPARPDAVAILRDDLCKAVQAMETATLGKLDLAYRVLEGAAKLSPDAGLDGAADGAAGESAPSDSPSPQHAHLTAAIQAYYSGLPGASASAAPAVSFRMQASYRNLYGGTTRRRPCLRARGL